MKAYLHSYKFLIPLFLLIGGFILLPVVSTVLNSFYQDVSYLPRRFVGLAHYRSLLAEPGFRQSIRFTLLFTLISVPLQLMIGLIIALLLNQHLPWRGLWRACILIPWAIPAAISARLWELIYNYQFGLANIVGEKLNLWAEPVNWLGTSVSAFWAVIVADTWKTAPFAAIILLAGLSSIPEDLYKQAAIDGTHFIQRFRLITLPMLRPVLLVTILFRTIDSLRVFDLIFVLTGGGPGGSTTSLSLYSQKYFLAGDFGYGSAVSVLLFLMAFGLALIAIRLGRFDDYNS